MSWHRQILRCRLYYQQTIPNTNVFLSSFFFSFFKLRERERERESVQLQYLGRVEGENGFKIYLAFRRRVFSESSFLLQASWILWSSAWRHLLYLVQELYFASSTGVLATVSTPLVTPTAVLKAAFLIPISANEKVFPALGFWAII